MSTLQRRAMVTGLVGMAASPAAIAAVDPRAEIARAAEQLTAAMARLHERDHWGDYWSATVDHDTGFILIMPRRRKAEVQP